MNTAQTGADGAKPTTNVFAFHGTTEHVADEVARANASMGFGTGLPGLLMWTVVDDSVVGGVVNNKLKPLQVVDYGGLDIPQVTDGDNHPAFKAVAVGRNGVTVVSYTGELDIDDVAQHAMELVKKGELKPDGDSNTVHLAAKGKGKIVLIENETGRTRPLNMDIFLQNQQADGDESQDYWLTVNRNGDLVVVISDGPNKGKVMGVSGNTVARYITKEDIPASLFGDRGIIALENNEVVLRTGKVTPDGEVVVNIGNKDDGKVIRVETYLIDMSLTIRDIRQPTSTWDINADELDIPPGYAFIGKGILPNSLALLDPNGRYMCVDIIDDETLQAINKGWTLEVDTDVKLGMKDTDSTGVDAKDGTTTDNNADDDTFQTQGTGEDTETDIDGDTSTQDETLEMDAADEDEVVDDEDQDNDGLDNSVNDGDGTNDDELTMSEQSEGDLTG